jgi:hypothetical protein
VRLDTRKWIASRVYRQVYGDRVDVEVNHTRISISAALEAAARRVIEMQRDEDTLRA